MSSQSNILTVTELNRQIRSWLEHEVGLVSVKGEISNLSKPQSGHFYFTLKDETAQLRCVYFRNRHKIDDHEKLQNGQQVLINGTLSLYEARGDYQLIVENLEEAGVGNLNQQFELLKIKLSALGLFEKARKKTFIKFPHTIGIITSATGAALRDILSTLLRRYPIAKVIVYASEVQGKKSAPQLINAISKANTSKMADVLILARGGGSIEDLWAFNDENLAFAISKSEIPIVTGVGHETDFTIADFVADLRAETPTAAAVAVTPNIVDLINELKNYELNLNTCIRRVLETKKLRLKHEMQKITSPKRVISSYSQSLDYLIKDLFRATLQLLSEKRQLIEMQNRRLEAKNPAILLQQNIGSLKLLEERLIINLKSKITNLKQQFAENIATLNALSPLATLERGYAIATFKNKALLNTESVKIGDEIKIRVASGSLLSKVIEKN